MIQFILGIIAGVFLFVAITGLVAWGYKQGLEEKKRKKGEKFERS